MDYNVIPTDAMEVIDMKLQETGESLVEINDEGTYLKVEYRLSDNSSFKLGDKVIVTIRKAE